MMTVRKTFTAALIFVAVAAYGQTKAPPKTPAPKPATAAKPAAAGKSALDKATLEAYVRHLAVWGPQIKVEIADPKPSTRLPGFMEVKVRASLGEQYNEEILLVSKDGQKILRPPVYDITQNPFKYEIDNLRTENAPGYGTPGAPVVLVVFSDYQCPYCREDAKTLRANIPKEFPTQVRVYFKDFPLESIHPWAKAGAMAGRCVFRQKAEAFWDFHDWIFDKSAEISPDNLKGKVLEWARGKGLDTFALNACIETKATEGEVNQSITEGRALGVDRTPYLFVNGRRVPGVPWQSLKQIIDFEIDYQKTANNAGDHACCSLSLPSLVK